MDGLNKRDAEAALARALCGGGDFAEIYWEDTLSGSVALIGGAVDSANTARSHGAGIRVYAGTGSVYVHTNDTSLAGLTRVAEQAAEAVNAAKIGLDIHLAGEGSPVPTPHAARLLPGDYPAQKKLDLLRRADSAARGVDACVSQVRATLTDSDRRVTICNSEGLFLSDRRVRVRMGIAAIAAGGGENQTGFEGPGALRGYELFEDTVDVEARAREAAQTAVTMLRAEECPAGEVPVVIAGGFGGVIFHEACGHSLEATSVALGNSEFCGKLNRVIASPAVTAIDDGTIPGAWGSLCVDDEGTPANRLVLIEKGVLKNYMIDRLNARKMGMKPTGSARRQSYAYAPTSRMRNTFIAPGGDAVEAMIATMGEGLYARKMGGGSVNPVTGEFNFSVAEGYWVKDGKIDRPVRGATLVGKGGEVLTRIDRVGKDLVLAEGMCGSISGSVPVCVGQPTIRVSRMTVGGRKQ